LDKADQLTADLHADDMKLEKLDPPIDLDHDHVLGPPDAELTLVEYGSYACPHCHAVHEVIEGLRSRFGERMRYVFRHLPVADNENALHAAALAEYAGETTGRFWEVHEALMERGPTFSKGDFERIAREFNLPGGATSEAVLETAHERVRQDAESARRSGARVTPTFFINGRRYAGTWDESSLADAMLAPLIENRRRDDDPAHRREIRMHEQRQRRQQAQRDPLLAYQPFPLGTHVAFECEQDQELRHQRGLTEAQHHDRQVAEDRDAREVREEIRNA